MGERRNCHFFPALLRYNWHRTLCNFKMYSVMIWYIYILYMMTTENAAFWVSHALGIAHSPTPVHTFSTLSHLTAKQFCEVSMVPFIQMWAWLFRRDWVTANERIPIYSPKYLSACSKDQCSLHLSILTSMISASVSGISQCPKAPGCPLVNVTQQPEFQTSLSHTMWERPSISFNCSNWRDRNHLCRNANQCLPASL